MAKNTTISLPLSHYRKTYVKVYNLKRCPKCKHTYPRNETNFNKNAATKDGFKCYCRMCENKIQVEYNKKRRHKRRIARHKRPQSKTKVCKCCKKRFARSHEFFYKARDAKDGLQSYCKMCDKKRHGAWQKDNLVQQKRYQNEWMSDKVQITITKIARDRLRAFADDMGMNYTEIVGCLLDNVDADE